MNLRRCIVGISASVACYKSLELIRLLKARGVACQVVMSANSTKLIRPPLFRAISEQPVIIDEWHEAQSEHGMDHIDATGDGRIDAVILAPATANLLGKIAHGIADDTLTSCIIANTAPLFIAPAMNPRMWHNPLVRRNIDLLKEAGATFIGPDDGEMACQEHGTGRMSEPAAILDAIVERLSSSQGIEKWRDKRILVSLGATRSYIDAVRFLTNGSSGRMGYAIADAAQRVGASVTVLAGSVCPEIAEKLKNASFLVRETSTNEAMREALSQLAPAADCFISCAAVADFEVKAPLPEKIKRGDDDLQLALSPAADLLGEVAHRPDAPICVGFAVETDDIVERAKAKMAKKNLAAIVANAIGDIDKKTCELTLISQKTVVQLPHTDKQSAAAQLIDFIGKECFP